MEAKRRKLNNKNNFDDFNIIEKNPFCLNQIEIINTDKLNDLQIIINSNNGMIHDLMQQYNEMMNKIKEQNIMINMLKDEIDNIKRGKSYMASATGKWDNSPSYIN